MNKLLENKGMTLIVKTITRITLPFILLFGLYLALRGHISPGGGFVGGVIIALAFIQIMLAFGKEVALRKLRAYAIRFTVSVSSLIFLYIVMFGWRIKYSQFVMPLCESLIVGAGVFAIFVALVLVSKSDRYSQ
jgi:multisubunit Na+/H+ antiporter MnhB subunit